MASSADFLDGVVHPHKPSALVIDSDNILEWMNDVHDVLMQQGQVIDGQQQSHFPDWNGVLGEGAS